MAKINTRRPVPPVLKTHEGGTAARISPELALRRSVLTCLLWEDGFYESGQMVADRIAGLVKEVDPRKVADLAASARTTFHLRHVPLLLARELLRHPKAKDFKVADLIAQVVQRPDEMAELLAIYWKDGKTPLAGQLKKGLAKAFGKFNAHQLSKWDSGKAQIRLRDVMFLTHPKPVGPDQKMVFEALANDKLEAADTWETRLSEGEGVKTAEQKETRWADLLKEHKLGGMALLRNLRNMIEAKVDLDLIRAELRRASGAGAFRRVLPFRFIAAAKHAPRLEDVIEEVMIAGLSGSQVLPGRTVVLVDNSGSMTEAGMYGRQNKSEMTPFDRAAGLAILLRELCADVRVFTYADRLWPEIPARRGFALRDALKTHGGGGTYLVGALAKLHGEPEPHTGRRSLYFTPVVSRYDKKVTDALKGAVGYDRIIVITDEQTADSRGGRLPAPNGVGYVINVAANQNGVGYGAWTHIDGFSEAVVRFIGEYEMLCVRKEG